MDQQETFHPVDSESLPNWHAPRIDTLKMELTLAEPGSGDDFDGRALAI